jgi:integrase
MEQALRRINDEYGHLARRGNSEARAGMVNVRIHGLRRTVGSWLAQNGATLHLIGDVLNHLDPKTTAGYAYFPTQQRRDVLTAHGVAQNFAVSSNEEAMTAVRSSRSGSGPAPAQ